MTYAKRRIRTIPRKKLGNETPASVTLVESRSIAELRLIAEMMPTTSATPTENTSAARPSAAVAGSRSTIASSTRWCVWNDRPRSPCASLVTHTTYWTGSGLSRPICSRIAASAVGSRSSPANTSAGSPGDRRMRMKTPIVTRKATGTMSTRRRRMYVVTPSPRLSAHPAVYFCSDAAWKRGMRSGYDSMPTRFFTVTSGETPNPYQTREGSSTV